MSAAIICYHQITKVKVQRNVNEFNRQNIGKYASVRFRSSECIQIHLFAKSNVQQREPLTRALKKIYNNPGLGLSRPATPMVINLSEEKRWQIKAFECSYFLYTTRQKELMSHYALAQITPREKNSSAQTAERVGSTPSGEVIFRLIGLCGIQWTWLHLPPTGLGFFQFLQCRDLRGIFPPPSNL